MWKKYTARQKLSNQIAGNSNDPGQLCANDLEMADLPSSQSMADILGADVGEDVFQKEVALKTQTQYVGRQEAETEVMIDWIIKKHGNKDKALLFVVSEVSTELKVQIFVNNLLHRGSNPSISDCEWQTPLHHAVKRNFKGVCAKLLESDALPHARDKHKKMPYHLAVESGNDEIAAMLLKYMPNRLVRELHLADDNKLAECSLHSLLHKDMMKSVMGILDCMIDPIGKTGHVRVFYHLLESDEHGRTPHHPEFSSNSKSCLHLISKGGFKSIVYHDVVRLLIRRKWKLFARFRFQMNTFMYCLTLIAMTFSVIVATMATEPASYVGALQISRAVTEVWTYLVVMTTFFIELNQFRKHKLDYWKDQFNWIDLSSSCLLIAVLPLRFTYRQEQWFVYSIGYLLWSLRIFKYAAVFRQTGAYSQILWRILEHDFIQFTILFAVILLTFSGSFVLALRGEESLQLHSETSNFWNILFTGVRSLIEAQPVVEYTGPDGYKTLSTILMVGFLFTCCVILLNILIAQVSDTYQNVQRDAQRGLELNRAWIITRVELNSLFIGKNSRISKYVEMEELTSPGDILEKWENPPLNEINKYIKDIWDSLESHKLTLLTVTNRLSRQEYALARIE
ncbi:uncharacterized protein LOC121370686 isoform X2 [Gigantopelta aegis]|nr:uncharacterized protein LOC121370686 isoform X2 [Gigantopelta aegis]